jgi:hypothetical protein
MTLNQAVNELQRAGSESQPLYPTEAIGIVLERLNHLSGLLYAISVMFEIEQWDDFPSGDVLGEIEKEVSSRTLKAFLRGQRSARAAQGQDPDEIPSGDGRLGPVR